MSVPQDVERLESLEEASIRGHLSIEDLVRRQVDRCNMSMGGDNTSIFDANVRALMKMLPSTKLDEILRRESEYNEVIHDWHYEYWCNVKMGTPDHPITSDDEPPNEDRSNVISPNPVSYTQTDYEKLYELVIQAFESVGLTWKVEARVAEFGKVIRTTIPGNVVTDAQNAVVQVVLDARATLIQKARETKTGAELRKAITTANHVGYTEIVEELRYLTPPTPVFEEA